MSQHVSVDVPTSADTSTENPAAEEQSTRQTAAPEATRPEGLPEKFKTVDDMVKAYKELEGKLGQKPAAPQETADPEVLEKPKIPDAPKALGSEALKPFHDEYTQNGQLSDDSFAKLEQMGLSRDLVENYIAGVQHRSSLEDARIYEAAGGQQHFEEMAKWAGSSLGEERVNALNELLAAGGEKATLAVQQLRQAYVEANGQEPNLLSGDGPTTGSTYASYAQMMQDMQDPRYQSDEAFREAVKNKLARSGNLL